MHAWLRAGFGVSSDDIPEAALFRLGDAARLLGLDPGKCSGQSFTHLEIQLDSVDKTLDDEISLDHALDNALLLFAGSEILSAFDLELLGVGHYRMSLVRARFDTKRNAHPDDSTTSPTPPTTSP